MSRARDRANYGSSIEPLGYIAGAVCMVCIAVIFAMSNRLGRIAVTGALLVAAVGFTVFVLYVTGTLAGLTS